MRTKVGAPFVQETLDQDKRGLEDLGFFSAVAVSGIPLDSGTWQVTILVTEWPEIKEIRVTGNTVVKTDDIVNVLTLKTGNVYNTNAVRSSADAIRKLYSSKGYYVQIPDFSPLKDSPNTLNIQLLELKVGTVGYQGNGRTKDWVMKRLIKTKPGDTFSEVKWANDIRRLLNTQWFDTVHSLADDQRELGMIDLTADVKEAKTGQFNVGVQLDPSSSFAGVIRLSENNFGGTGKSVGLNFIQATQGDGPSVDLDYTNPFFDSKDTQLHMALYSRLVYRFSNSFLGTGGSDLTSASRYTERRTGATLGFNRPVTDYLSLGLSGRLETIKTSQNNGLTQPNFISQDGTVGGLTFGATRNRRDVDVDPSRGDWMQLQVEPGYADITKSTIISNGVPLQGGTGKGMFGRGVLEYRKYFSPGPPRGTDLEAPRNVVAFRAKFGVITGQVPFFEQFFAGGSDTVRGYAEDRFWGKQTLISTLEYRKPIQKSFNVIGFVDYGGAWGGYKSIADFRQSEKLKLHLGYGVGLSFRTPLGPIRLDLGFDERGRSRTHFLIGNSF